MKSSLPTLWWNSRPIPWFRLYCRSALARAFSRPKLHLYLNKVGCYQSSQVFLFVCSDDNISRIDWKCMKLWGSFLVVFHLQATIGVKGSCARCFVYKALLNFPIVLILHNSSPFSQRATYLTNYWITQEGGVYHKHCKGLGTFNLMTCLLWHQYFEVIRTQRYA